MSRRVFPVLALTAGTILASAAPALAARGETLVEPQLDDGAPAPGDLAASLATALVPGQAPRPWLESEAPPAPQADLKRARRLAAQGRARYRAFAIEEAVRLLTGARAAYDRALTALDDFSELIDLRVDLAQALLDAGLGPAADAELRAVARLAPALELDPARHPPALLDAFARARGAVSMQPAARVRVQATVAATVIVDGSARGTTPLDLTLPAGDHLLRLRAPGHREAVERLHLSPSARVTRRVTLPATSAGAAYERLRRALARGADDELAAAADLGRLAGVARILVPRIAERGGACIVAVAVVDTRTARRTSLAVTAADGTCAAFPPAALEEVARKAKDPGTTYLRAARDAARREALGLDPRRLCGVGAAPEAVAVRPTRVRPAPPPVVVEQPLPPAPPPPPPRRSWLRSPWLWTAVVAVAGGTAAAFFFGFHKTVRDPDRVEVILPWQQ